MTISRPAIRDVARRASVSHQAVSRVINGSAEVLPETRALVEAAIEKMGYRPSAIARSMARGLTHTLACISPNLTDYTFASVIEGAETEARQHDYFILSSSAADPDSFRQLGDELVVHRRVDGLIIINLYSDERFEYVPENFAVVYVGARSHGENISQETNLDFDESMIIERDWSATSGQQSLQLGCSAPAFCPALGRYLHRIERHRA